MTRINVVQASDKGVNVSVHVHEHIAAPNHKPALETASADSAR